MSEAQLINSVIFAEADKSSLKNFINDAMKIMSLIDNRKNNPDRWGQDSWSGVVLDDGEFSSIGSDEFNKAMEGVVTKEEEIFLKKAAQIRKGFETGVLTDTINGADHMHNPSIDPENSWNTRTKEIDAKVGEMYYPETASSKAHIFRKETMRMSEKQKSIMNTQEALNNRGFELKEDGIMGENTREAIKDFQAASGLKVDGIAGSNTQAALKKVEL